MEVTATAIPDVKILTPRRHGDPRGFFTETYNRRSWAEHGLDFDFAQDNLSLSATVGTVRGLHFQTPPHAQAKLVSVLHGAALDVAVDIRAGSPTFGRHVGVTLSAEDGRQMLIPVGFAHGFCTLRPDTLFAYKVTGYYAPDHDKGVLWNDPALAIDWPVTAAAAVVSDKDAAQPTLAELPDYFTYRAASETSG